MIPTEGLKYPEVWEALTYNMPIGALIRNLGNLGKVGLLDARSLLSEFVADQITDREFLSNGRIHPLNVYMALKTYAQGHSVRGSGTWVPNPNISDALNEAFYASFEYNLEPNSNIVLHSVDVSGSMRWVTARTCNNLMTAFEGAALMMMAGMYQDYTAYATWFHRECGPLHVRKGMPIDIAVDHIKQTNSGGTAVNAPIEYAFQQGISVDAFVIYTDNETWADINRHPQQSLERYRKTINPAAKAVIVAMVPTGYTTLDPNDPGVLQVVGFDSSVPSLIQNFLGDA